MTDYGRLLVVEVSRDNPIVSANHTLPDILPARENLYNGFHKFTSYCDLDPQVLPHDIVVAKFSQGHDIGRIICVNFSQDFGLILYDSLWSRKPVISTHKGDDWYVLSLRLAGETLELIGDEKFLNRGYTCSMVHYTENLKHVSWIDKCEPFVEVSINFRASLLMDKLNISRKELDTILSDHGVNCSGTSYIHRPFDSDLAVMAHDLINYNTSLLTYRLSVEAKSLEILGAFFSNLESQWQGVVGCGKINYRDIQSIDKVKFYIESNYVHPPRKDELCRMFGLNRRKLSEIFKNRFGITVYDYIQFLRIEKSKSLLQNSNKSINYIALKVGYCYQSNFSKAFLKQVGLSPTSYIKKFR